ncbi:MAG: hypothetical protein K2L12_01155 [Clostridia bacterium]|nr:hypothetical protein [Clostridia bacterium]
MKGKKLSKKIIFWIVCSAIIGTILIACLGLQIAFMIADKIECWHPDYEMVSIKSVLNQQELSDEDYELIYRQTGVTKLGVDRMLARGQRGKQQLIKIQEDFFAEHPVQNDLFAPLVCTDYIEDDITYVDLEDGDIILTSSTHLSGWRIGHSGLVTNASFGSILQANAIGDTSTLGSMRDFSDRVNFMIVSPKVDKELKAKVCRYAEENLIGKVYDPTAGVFSKKDSLSKTQCAHLVWYAYNHFGVDLDCGGGLVVTPKDIANSPLVEIVQVFGFDIDNLWKY